jgi:two-component system phosphate regulon response regulator PhoB
MHNFVLGGVGAPLIATERTTTILIVEDDLDARALFRAALMLAGYTVATSGDGFEALRYIEAHGPSLVVLDLGLPCVSGRDVAREIAAHAETARIPIVVVTGETGDLDPRELPCVLRKPFDSEDLVATVRVCLRQSQRRHSSRE